MSRSVGVQPTTFYRSAYSESSVRESAYPWQSEGLGDETAPSGLTRTSSTTRTPEELQEELNKLKDSGVPLQSMKLVPNTDLDALEGDTTRVFGLNERLARYVLYVSQLEKSNRELGEKGDALAASLAAERADSDAAKEAFNAERRELATRAAASDRMHQDSLERIDALKHDLVAAQRDSNAKTQELAAALTKAKVAEDAAEGLRNYMEQQGLRVPDELNPNAIAAAQRKEAFTGKVKDALAARMGGAPSGGPKPPSGLGAGGLPPGVSAQQELDKVLNRIRLLEEKRLREGLTPDEARELQKLKGKVPLLQNASEQEMVMNRIAQLEAKAKIPPGLSPEEDAELARLKAKLGQLERAERGLLIDRIAELERKSLIPPGLTPEEQAELARLKTRLSEVDEKDELKNRIGELQAKAKIPPGLSAEEEAELTRLRGRMAALNGMGASDSYSLARDAAEKAAEADAARARLNELQRKWADGTITPDELEEMEKIMGKLPMSVAEEAAARAQIARLREIERTRPLTPEELAELQALQNRLPMAASDAAASRARISELKRKLADGTITPEEMAELTAQEGWLAQLDEAAEQAAAQAAAAAAASQAGGYGSGGMGDWVNSPHFASDCERMFDAAMAAAERARLDTRIRTLQSTGTPIPIDERAMEEQLMGRFSPEQLAQILSDDVDKGVAVMLAKGLDPPYDDVRMEMTLRQLLSPLEFEELRAKEVAAEMRALASQRVALPVNGALEGKVKATLTELELQTLDRLELDARLIKLREHADKPGKPVELQQALLAKLDDGSGAEEIVRLCEVHLEADERLALGSELAAGRVQALADHGVMAPMVDELRLASLVASDLPPPVRDAVLSAKRRNRARIIQNRTGQAPAIDEAELELVLQETLIGDEYEALLAERRGRRVALHAAKGMQVPVDEDKVNELLGENMSWEELMALKAEETDQMKRAAKTALRLEMLLQKEVNISDELLLACQRGESWALGDLEKLCELHLLPEEMDVLRVMQEASMTMIDDMENNDPLYQRGGLKGKKAPSGNERLNALERKKQREGLTPAEQAEMEKLKAKAVDDRLAALRQKAANPPPGLTDEEAAEMANLERLKALKMKKANAPPQLSPSEEAELGRLTKAADLQRKKREQGLSPDELVEADRLNKIQLLEVKAREEGLSPEEQAVLEKLKRQQQLHEAATKYALEQETMLNLQRSQLEDEYLERLREASQELRRQLNIDLESEQLARREAQARNLALLDAIESQRARNAELQAKLAEHEARELERLRQLEALARSRELEVDAFRLQAERSIQDAAEARSKREQLERAIQQYEMILNAMGLGALSFDDDIDAIKKRISELQRKKATVGLSPEEEAELQRTRNRLGELEHEKEKAGLNDSIKALEVKKANEGLTPEEEEELDALKSRLDQLEKNGPAGAKYGGGGGLGEGSAVAALGMGPYGEGGPYAPGNAFGSAAGGDPLGANGPQAKAIRDRVEALERKKSLEGLTPQEEAELHRLKGRLAALSGMPGARRRDPNAAFNEGLGAPGDNIPDDPTALKDRIAELQRKAAFPPGLTPLEEEELANLKERLDLVEEGEYSGDYSGSGSGYATLSSRRGQMLSVASALPAHLVQLEQFVLLTDEGHVAVRARLNGTVAYLKRQVATQLHISPRLTLTISSSTSSQLLNDDVIISQYAEGRSSERLLLSAAPRPLSDFFPGSSTLPQLRQVRVRPTLRGVPENNSVIVRGVRETTTIKELQELLTKQPGLLPMVAGLPPKAVALYFSPVFITPDVLLGRAERQMLAPTQTLLGAQVIEDDIIYLALE